jgi:hypothetical protein
MGIEITITGGIELFVGILARSATVPWALSPLTAL